MMGRHRAVRRGATMSQVACDLCGTPSDGAERCARCGQRMRAPTSPRPAPAAPASARATPLRLAGHLLGRSAASTTARAGSGRADARDLMPRDGSRDGRRKGGLAWAAAAAFSRRPGSGEGGSRPRPATAAKLGEDGRGPSPAGPRSRSRPRTRPANRRRDQRDRPSLAHPEAPSRSAAGMHGRDRHGLSMSGADR